MLPFARRSAAALKCGPPRLSARAWQDQRPARKSGPAVSAPMGGGSCLAVELSTIVHKSQLSTNGNVIVQRTKARGTRMRGRDCAQGRGRPCNIGANPFPQRSGQMASSAKLFRQPVLIRAQSTAKGCGAFARGTGNKAETSAACRAGHLSLPPARPMSRPSRWAPAFASLPNKAISQKVKFLFRVLGHSPQRFRVECLCEY